MGFFVVVVAVFLFSLKGNKHLSVTVPGKRRCQGHKFQEGNWMRMKWAHNADSTASSTSAAVAAATAQGDAHSSADQSYASCFRKSVAQKCGKM